MKKIIVFLLVTFIMIIPFSSVYADDNKVVDKSKRAEFKAQIKTQKDALKQLRDRNQALRDQIKQKHVQINAAIKELRKNKDDASKAKLDQVKATLQSLTTSKEGLKGLRDAGKPYWEALKGNVKNMNLEGALSNINSIAGVRDSRYEILVKINTTLDAVLNILK